MEGLLMKKEYLFQILNGIKQYDARLYNTSVRGRIGLIDSDTLVLYGYVTLVGVDEISYEEYLRWHQDDIEIKSNKKRIAYAYHLVNPITIELPIIVNPIRKHTCFITFNHNDTVKSYKQLSLF